MRIKGIICGLAIAVIAGGCASQFHSSRQIPALNEVQGLSDPDFNGGLTNPEMQLAQRLADQVSAELPGDLGVCNPRRDPDTPPPTYGAVEHANPEDLAKQVSAPLAPLAQVILHGSPEQRAVVAHSVELMGKRAGGLEFFLYVEYKQGLNPWIEGALHAINCEESWWNGGLEAMVPKLKLPPPNASGSCNTARVYWVLDAMADDRRHWPREFLISAYNSAANTCEDDKRNSVLSVPDEVLLKFRPLLDSPNPDSQALSDALFVLAHMDTSTKVTALDALRWTDSTDRDTALWADQIVLAAAIPQSVEVIRKMVSQGYGLPRDEPLIAGLAKYSDQMIPILAQDLQSPYFDTRAGAANGLGAMHSPKAIPYLVGAISDNDWPTTQAAVAALAQFVTTHPEVRKKLEDIQRTYWSGRVRRVAEIALATGRGFTGDPFDKCFYDDNGAHSVDEMNQDHNDLSKVRCIHYGPQQIDHRQKHCKDGTLHAGTYAMQSRQTIKINWQLPGDQPMPRGTAADIAYACKHGGIVQVAPVKDGWIAGCAGFEWGGGLIFIPADTSIPVEAIASNYGVRLIVGTGGRIFVNGIDGDSFEGISILNELKRNAYGKWEIGESVVLPTIPSGYAIVGNSIAFVDDYTASLYDPDKGLSLLVCED